MFKGEEESQLVGTAYANARPDSHTQSPQCSWSHLLGTEVTPWPLTRGPTGPGPELQRDLCFQKVTVIRMLLCLQLWILKMSTSSDTGSLERSPGTCTFTGIG